MKLYTLLCYDNSGNQDIVEQIEAETLEQAEDILADRNIEVNEVLEVMEVTTMKVIDIVTRRYHAAYPVLNGYMVCLIPDMACEDANPFDVHYFLDKEFDARFDIVK